MVDTRVSMLAHDGTTGHIIRHWWDRMLIFKLYTNSCARAVFQMAEVLRPFEICLLLLDSGGGRYKMETAPRINFLRLPGGAGTRVWCRL